MNTYSKWLLILGVVAVLGLAGWLYMIHASILTTAENMQKTTVAQLVNMQAPNYVVAADFQNADPAHTASVFGALWNAVQSPDYVRMKVWVSGYTVIWSNLPQLIGQKFPAFDEFDEAIKGETVFDLESQKGENVGERQYDTLGETYVPFTDANGSVVGIIELYNVPTAMDNEVMSEFDHSLPMPIATVLVGYAVIALALKFLLKKKMAGGATPSPAA